MFQWAKSRNIETMPMLPDGNASFTRLMGMLVDRSTHGMAARPLKSEFSMAVGMMK